MRKEINELKEQNAKTKDELTVQNSELKLQLKQMTAREADLSQQLQRMYQDREQYRRQEKDYLSYEFAREKAEILTQQRILEEEIERLKQENENLKQNPNGIDTGDISFWEVSGDDIQTHGKPIGTGAWGYVARGTYKEHPVAVKCLHQNIVTPATIQLLRREVAVMAKVRHPCLLLFIGVSFSHSSGSPMIITELMECSLRDAYQEPRKLNIKSKMKIMMDIACALHYLHTHKDKILHRDVSSANVLLVDKNKDNNYRGKLSDFGSANFTRFATTSVPGAFVYMAPEVLRDSKSASSNLIPQTSKIDVYSYGILLSEVFAQNPQIPLNMDLVEEFKESIKAHFLFVYQQIEKCICIDPDNRPEIIDVLKVFKSKFPNL